VPSSIFTNILQDAARSNVSAASKGEEARKWFRNKAMEIKKADTKRILANSQDRYRQSMVPGTMYMFYYDPKYKNELPFYDQFPLIFPLSVEKDSILGINFHYLQPVLRAKLMDALYTHVTNEKLTDTAKMQISYKILKGASNFNLVKPTIKRYLKTHVRSRFVKVYPNEWDVAIMLPLQSFVKATPNKVWAESRKIAGV
jgi:hypothetical protein